MAEVGEFHYKPPPDCPVFHPSVKEFADPLGYIARIRPRAEPYGICKIRPPAGWEPPFSVNVNTFKFVPRIQRINELEAHTRIRINFLDRIAKFWELQGSALQLPTIGKQALDLYRFYHLVRSNGGFDSLADEVAWDAVGKTLGYKESCGAALEKCYKKILYPFELFEDGKSLNHLQLKTPKPGETRRRGRRPGWKSSKNAWADPLAKYVCQTCRRGDGEDQMLLCDGCDESWHTYCLIPPLAEIPPGDWRCPKCVAIEVRKPADGFGFEQASREYTLPAFGRMADDFKTEYFKRTPHSVPVHEVEREFWKIVGTIDADVSVEYGADLHTMDHGSGFPTASKDDDSGPVNPMVRYYQESKWNLNNLPVLDGSLLRYINSDISGMMVPWMYVGMCFSTFCWHNEDHWSYSINYLHWGEPKTWYGVPGNRADDFEEVMKGVAPELFENQPDLLHQLVTIMNPNILMNEGIPIFRCMQNAGEFEITFPRAYHAGFNQGYNFAEAVNFCPPDWLQKGRNCIKHYSVAKRFCVFSQDELVCKMAGEMRDLPLDVAAATIEDLNKMRQLEIIFRRGLMDAGITKSSRELFELLNDDVRQCEVCKTTLFLSAVSCSCNNQFACLRHFKELCTCPPARKVFRYRYTLDELKTLTARLQKQTIPFKKWLKDASDVLGLVNAGSPRKPTLAEVSSLIVRARALKVERSEIVTAVKSLEDQASKLSRVARRILHMNSFDPVVINEVKVVEILSDEPPKKRTTPLSSEVEKELLKRSDFHSLKSSIPPVIVDYRPEMAGDEGVVRCETPHPHAGDCVLEPVDVPDGRKRCLHERIRFDDFRRFMEDVEECQARIPEYEQLVAVSEAAEKLAAEVLKLHEMEDLRDVDVEGLLLECVKIFVEIPHAEALKLRYDAMQWIDKANEILESKQRASREEVTLLLADYDEDYDTEGGAEVHVRLKRFDNAIRDQDVIAGELLMVKPAIPFGRLEAWVQASKTLPPGKHRTELMAVYSVCVEWMRKITAILASPNIALLDDVEPLMKEAAVIGVKVPHFRDMEIQVATCRKWVSRAKQLIPPRPGLTILEVFLPSNNYKTQWAEACKQKLIETVEEILARYGFSLRSFENATKLNEEYMAIVKSEIISMHELRVQNLKISTPQCICCNPDEVRDSLLRCELCKAQYHVTCVPYPTSRIEVANRSKLPPSAASRNLEQRFLCPRCIKCDRVPLSTIIEFINTLEGNRFRTFEGDAFQCFARRIIDWKTKAQDALLNPDRITSLVTLPKKEVEKPIKPNPVVMKVEKETESVNAENEGSDERKKHPRKSAHVVLEDGSQPVEGPHEIRECFEWLLMEGLLLEVLLPEVDDIWQLLQRARRKEDLHVIPDCVLIERENVKRRKELLDRYVSRSQKKGMRPDGKPKSVPRHHEPSSKRPRKDESDSSKSSDGSDSDDSSSSSGSGSGSGSGGSSGSGSDDSDSDDGDDGDKKPPKEQAQKKADDAADEICSAKPCKKPTGDKVEWVMCDACEEWYHFLCVGLKRGTDVEDKQYTCPPCRATKKRRKR